MPLFPDGFMRPTLRHSGGGFAAATLCALALFGLSGLSSPAFAQETLSSVQRELDRVEREIERERELHRQERARAEEFDRQKDVRLQALRDQMALTDARIDSLRGRMETEQRRRTAQRNVAAQFQQRQQAFRRDLGREIDTMLAWVNGDFPYQRERRVSEWRDLAEGNRESTIPVEEVLMRLFGLVETSIDFSRNTEAYPGTYTTASGARHEGFYVRAGAVLMVFSSNDGQVQAYLARENGAYVWREDGLSSDVRGSIRTAVSVAQGREAPRLVPLPVEVAAKGGAQ